MPNRFEDVKKELGDLLGEELSFRDIMISNDGSPIVRILSAELFDELISATNQQPKILNTKNKISFNFEYEHDKDDIWTVSLVGKGILYFLVNYGDKYKLY